eukprot:7129236-Prymnesium_polylepis.1
MWRFAVAVLLAAGTCTRATASPLPYCTGVGQGSGTTANQAGKRLRVRWDSWSSSQVNESNHCLALPAWAPPLQSPRTALTCVSSRLPPLLQLTTSVAAILLKQMYGLNVELLSAVSPGVRPLRDVALGHHDVAMEAWSLGKEEEWQTYGDPLATTTLPYN